MKLLLSLAIALSAGLHSAPVQAADSRIQQITTLQYRDDFKALYIKGVQGWGAPSCPNATWAIVTDLTTNPGRKNLVALAMLAKATGAQVIVAGECAPWDGDVFLVSLIAVL
jgi:hypothetical protein